MKRLERKVNKPLWRGSGKKTSQHDQQNTVQAWVFRQTRSVTEVRSPSGQTEVRQHPAGAVSTHVARMVNRLWSLCETDPSFKGPLSWMGWLHPRVFAIWFNPSVSPESWHRQFQTSVTYLLVYLLEHTRSPTLNVDKQLVWQFTLTTMTPFCLTLT